MSPTESTQKKMSRPARPVTESLAHDMGGEIGNSEMASDELDIESLIDEHSGAVFRYAYRLVGTQSDAEDLTQQAFLIAHQKLGQLKTATSARGWLFTIVRNCYLKGLRKKNPTCASAIELNVEEIPQRTKDLPPIDSSTLQQSINSLPEEFKIVVVLYYFEKLSYKEIAEKLELKIGTVMSRLSRAKGRMRQLLLHEESNRD